LSDVKESGAQSNHVAFFGAKSLVRSTCGGLGQLSPDFILITMLPGLDTQIQTCLRDAYGSKKKQAGQE
jgi:hypothetical protein